MVEPLTILSVAFGGAALLVAIYSRHKQKAVEEQLDRKARLRHIADTLEDANDKIQEFQQLLDRPMERSRLELDTQLKMCAKEILSVRHKTGETSQVTVSKFKGKQGGDFQPVQNAEKALDILKNGKLVTVGITISHEEAEDIIYSIDDMYFEIKYVYEDLDLLTESDIKLIEEFDSGLLSELESLLDHVIIELSNRILNSDVLEVNPDDYDSIEQMGEDLYHSIVIYDGWEADGPKLESLSQRIESVRQTMIQTSYS